MVGSVPRPNGETIPVSAAIRLISSVPPAEGKAHMLAPGVHWVRHPLPFALDHVNVWLLEDGATWTLVDTGVHSSRSQSAWEAVFAGPMQGRSASRVLATHFHPDHIGLAAWLCQRFSSDLWTSRSEWLLARLLHQDQTSALRDEIRTFYSAAGLDDEQTQALTERGNAYARGVPALPARYHRLRQGDGVRIGDRLWRVVTGGGHSPEHVCLACEDAGLLIAGDMILPGISPNVSVWANEPDADPLSEFFDGLSRLRGLPDDLLVLPSHGVPFYGLHGRIDELLHHHEIRLSEVMDACAAAPQSVGDITRLLFRRPLDTHQLSFAVGEALAHLNHLVARGQVRRETDAAGRWWFQRR